MRATGPVPDAIEQAAAQGDPLYQIVKLTWERGGLVIPVGNGQYVVPMPDKIPEGFAYPPETVTGAAIPEQAPPSADSQPPPFLAPSDFDLYQQLMASGGSFKLVRGSDGYRHVQR